MRGFLLAGIAFASAIPGLGALPAVASSLDYVRQPQASAPSVTVLSCTGCPALKPDTRAVTYVVPHLAPGTDRTEVQTINGEIKVVRAEAWLGGSPVRYVRKASDEEIRIALGKPETPALALHATAGGDAGAGVLATTGVNATVDTSMTTAALGAATAHSIASASIAPGTGSGAASVATPIAARDAAESSSHDFDGQSFQLRLN